MNDVMVAPARASGSRGLSLAVLALPTLLISMDQSILYLALPKLSVSLGASSTASLWVMDTFSIFLAGFLVIMGSLGDRIGRRRLLIYGAAVFGVATTLAAFSSTVMMLIVMRAVMGVAGATLMPSTLALIRTVFTDPKQRQAAIAAWFSCLMVGAVIGPLVGGVLLNSFWWGSVFLIGLPVMVLLIIVAPFVLPESRDANGGRLDLGSALLSLAVTMPIIGGVTEFGRADYAGAVVLVVLGLLMAGVFVMRQRRLTDPMVDLAMFRKPQFGTALTILLFGSMTTAGMYFLVSMYLQGLRGYTALHAGLLLLLPTLSIVVSSMITPALAAKIRPGVLMGLGLLVTACGFALLAFVPASGGIALLIVAFMLSFFGAGPTGAFGTDLVVGSAPPNRAGSAASLSETCNHLGVATGIAVYGTIGAAVYRSRIGSADLPSGVDQGQVHDSMIRAMAVVKTLPDDIAATLRHLVGDAFVTGLHAAAWLGVAASVVLGLLALAMLRSIMPARPAAPTPAPTATEEVAPSQA